MAKTLNTLKKSDWLSHLYGYVFALDFFFGSISVLNTLHLEFFFNIPRPVNVTIIDPTTDLIALLASLVGLSVLTFLYSHSSTLSIRVAQVGITIMMVTLGVLVLWQPVFRQVAVLLLLLLLSLVEFALLFSRRLNHEASISTMLPILVQLFAILAVMEVSSAIYYVTRSFGSSFGQVGLTDSIIELQLSYVGYQLIPWLYAAFLFSWLWIPPVITLVSQSTRVSQTLNVLGQMPPSSNDTNEATSSRLERILDPRLFVALAVAVFIGYYVYLQNPPWLVGTDAYWRYYDPLIRMNGRGGVAGLLQASRERHPVPLAILYSAQLTFHLSAFEVIRYAPLFLVTGVGFATSWFLGANRKTEFGTVTFLMAVLSIVTTIGFYSSILANWIAVLCWIAFFAYVGSRSSKHIGVRDFLVLGLLSTAILLLHPWTWGVFAVAVCLAAVLGLIKERRRGARLAVFLLLTVAIDGVFAVLSIVILAQTQGWRVLEALSIFSSTTSNPSSLLLFWNALTRLTEIWAPFFSPLYLIISIIGVFCLRYSNLTSWRKYLIWGWLCVAGLGSILVAPVGFDPARPTQTESELWRMLFLTPFPITTPLGIAGILQVPNLIRQNQDVSDRRNGHSARRLSWMGILLVLGICLAFAQVWGRFVILTIAVPALAAFASLKFKFQERELLRDALFVWLLLVAANSTMRSLSLVLLDPHNYRTAR